MVAGALYGFGAWHLNYVVAGHFMLISNQWLPFYALYLVRLPRRAWRDAGLLGAFFGVDGVDGADVCAVFGIADDFLSCVSGG